MAIQTSLFGKINGKLGSVVFSTSGGYTIAREYNPNVANPNTMAQVNQRARMKLMSQISASLVQSLAYTKTGLVSARNKFVKRNFASTYALNGVAQCSYENLQLTEGNLGLPPIGMTAFDESGQRYMTGALAGAPDTNINRVVWSFFNKSTEGKLSFVTSVISTQRQDTTIGGYFSFTRVAVPDGDIVVYAYGMIDTSENATAHYGELNVTSGSDLARLVATRSISFSDYQFTQTRGATMGANNSQVTPSEPGELRVFVTALGEGGTVSGGGSFAPGTSVTVVATPASGFDFVRWAYNGTNNTASTDESYTFVVNQQTDLVAIFEVHNNDTL